MTPSYLSDSAIHKFIVAALEEDIGDGDHSTLGSVPPEKISTAQLLVKDNGILAGVRLAELIYKYFDASLITEYFKKDGDPIKPGDIVFTITGRAQKILSTERLILNCMQRMSGIATYTNRLCRLIEGTKSRLLDTRKTTPNFRLMEKWAVHIGGGLNHRFALYDMVMLKDNHIAAAGGIRKAVEQIRRYLSKINKPLKIEVETKTLEEVKQGLTASVDIIMLDNMDIKQINEAMKIIAGNCKTEASGGITEENIRAIAETGVDYISVGALTHSVKSLDMSLKITK